MWQISPIWYDNNYLHPEKLDSISYGYNSLYVARWGQFQDGVNSNSMWGTAPDGSWSM